LYFGMTFTCAQNYYVDTSTFHRHTVKHCKNSLKLLKLCNLGLTWNVSRH